MAPRAHSNWPKPAALFGTAASSMPDTAMAEAKASNLDIVRRAKLSNAPAYCKRRICGETDAGPADATFGPKFRSGQCLDPRAALYRNVRECGRDYLRLNRSFAGIMSTFFISWPYQITEGFGRLADFGAIDAAMQRGRCCILAGGDGLRPAPRHAAAALFSCQT